jgi:3-oxoacyl-[acyl-carrier protein] reductase
MTDKPRNVLVTGASRGLGLGIARRLTAAGYQVIAVARSKSKPVSEAIAEVERGGRGRLHFAACDLGQIEAIPNLVKDLRKEFGPLYGLVNNAAVGHDGALAVMHNARIEELVRLNTLSPLVLTKYIVRGMMAEGTGRIVNVASIIGFTGYSGLAAYAATKAAMLGFTRSLAREVGRLGINVNAVAPGFLDTEMTHGLAGEQRAQVVRRSALRRLADVDDVASAVEFLLGEGARSISGTVLTVDAGATASAVPPHRASAGAIRLRHGVPDPKPLKAWPLRAVTFAVAPERSCPSAAELRSACITKRLPRQPQTDIRKPR